LTYLDNYKARLLSQGGALRDAHKDAAKNAVNENFANSPSYRTFTIDGVNAEGIIQSDRSFDFKVILFRPDTVYNRGSYVSIDGDTWMITDYNGSDVYPKAMLQRCNRTLTFTVLGSAMSYPCVMNSSGNVGQFNLKVDKFVTTIDGDYFVFAKYNEDTSTVKEGTRFLIDGGAFEVVGCDSITTVLNGNGYLRFHVKPDLIRDSDSTNTGVADNNKQKSSRDKLW
jgi:hypothetical protein